MFVFVFCLFFVVCWIVGGVGDSHSTVEILQRPKIPGEHLELEINQQVKAKNVVQGER